MRPLCLFPLAAIVVTTAFAQNPLGTPPNNYKLVMENEWVRVVRVHYGPNARLPVHEHTVAPATYVYLADGDPVRFQRFEPYQVTATTWNPSEVAATSSESNLKAR